MRGMCKKEGVEHMLSSGHVNVMRLQKRLSKALRTYEQLWYDGWCRTVLAAQQGLNATVIVRHPDDSQLYTNFDPDLVQLVRERLAMPAAPPKRAVASQGRAAGGTRAAEANPYGKAFNVRECRGTRAAFAAAGVPPLALPPALPPLPLLPNAAAGPVSAAAFAAGELSYRSVRLVLKGKRARVCDH